MRDLFTLRPLRRALIIAIVFAIVVGEWISSLLDRAFRGVIRALGLEAFEQKLAALPLWCAFPLTFVPVGVFVFCELYQYVVLAKGYYALFFFFHVGKWAALPLMNYVLRIYGVRLRKEWWLRPLYVRYRWSHRVVFAWLRRNPYYRVAVELKRLISMRVHELVLAVKARFQDVRIVAKQWFATNKHTIFSSAWRMRNRARRKRK